MSVVQAAGRRLYALTQTAKERGQRRTTQPYTATCADVRITYA